MNILLFLPGLLVLLVQYRGILGTLEGVSLIAVTQVSPPACPNLLIPTLTWNPATPPLPVLPLP